MSYELEELIAEQENTLRLIEKAQINFKKSPKIRLTAGYIQVRIETLDNYWNNFRTTHSIIVKITTKEVKLTNMYFTGDIYETCEELYINFKADMTDMLENGSEKISTVVHTKDSNSCVQEVKLPKINIPQFNGNYQDWTSFHDLYVSLIHKNKNLSNVQKLHYLKSSLTAEAEQLLKHISITEANYELAWSALNNRYNNKRIIVNSILTRLVNQKRIITGTAKSIRELLDTTIECLNKLKTQDIDTSTWDALVIFLTVTKLDTESHKEWEEEISSLEISELPTLKILEKFLEKRFRVLEMIQPTTSRSNQQIIKTKSFLSANSPTQCAYCKEEHRIYHCKEFIKLDTDKKREFVQHQRLCFNCLIPGHSVKFCKNKMSCHRCGKKHHSLLHRITNTSTPISQDTITQEKEIVSHLTTGNTTALMSTAVVIVTNEVGQSYKLRALLDPCSQESFITESAAQMMGLRKTSVSGRVSGVGQMNTPIKFSTNIEISSRFEPKQTIKITTYIVKKITNIMPSNQVQFKHWIHLQDLELADPTYHQPGHIDLLLGLDVYNDVIQPGLIKGSPSSPIAFQTRLGWVLSGKVPIEEEGQGESNIISMHLNMELNNMLRKFWELENMEDDKTLTPNEVKAEELYEKTTTRNEDGRYIVSLPFKNDPPNLPHNSLEIAKKRWSSTENKLNRNPTLKEKYNKVLEEYLTLNHMEKIDVEELKQDKPYVYLPHHGVIKEDKVTTPCRVVFDASCKGTNGISLNDELLTGPLLTEELRTIIMRWRKHKVAFVADVEKMYRQIRINDAHKDHQRIIWRPDITQPINHYRLLTVTFGTSCAPYLAVKTLKQVAIDEGDEYPETKKMILEDFYIDDILSGKDDDDNAIKAQDEITNILLAGGFKLQKWCSNSEKFMNKLKQDLNQEEISKVEIHNKESIKTLGITWEVKEDKLTISNQIKVTNNENITKRTVLSEIASLFDPMGWMTPAIVLAKIFMQKLWKSGISWDSELSSELKKEWLKFKEELPALKFVSLNRWINTTQNTISLEIHGYGDASAAAYSAVVYSRVIDENGQVKVSLLMAKSKVAPLKQVSLPRLELCAATLLSKLLKQVANALKVEDKDVYAWSDSQVVLAWLHGDPLRWKPFVKNRVVEILETWNANHWYYVNTKHNPADPASRGVMPAKLLSTDLWWNGPENLKQKEIKLEKGNNLETILERKKTIITTLVTTTEEKGNEEEILTMLRKYSSLDKLVRVLAYCRRWLKVLTKNTQHLPAYITYEERSVALTTCVRWSQEIEFFEEIHDLKEKKTVKSKSRLSPLVPFLDDKGVIRVGGRLRHANLDFDQKHPIIISKDNVLLPLLLSEAHTHTLHGGPQLLKNYLRKRFWLINSGNTVKGFVRNCITCARLKVKTRQQLMGDLPKSRVKPSRPFSVTGTDFAGPINTRMSKGRGAKSFKSYICLFVCMSTKALHLELVSDMTTQAFLAAFRRFVSRRGRVYELWSDNGTTFVGAEKEIIEMWKQGKSGIPEEFSMILDKEGTKWRYIPPGAPNFGGLWEAGVKSTKFHLKRIIGESTLTFEEMNTVLTQIEACLNSRPLSPLSDHPDDYTPLTPGHFLIGEPPVVLPSPDHTISNISPLERWKLTQRMVQDFWKRWNLEYINTLQERSKWKQEMKEFDIGDLVLIKDIRLPPGQWPMGRIIKKYPGHDNLTRTYDIRVPNGTFTRSVTKLVSLPKVSQ